MWIMHMWDKGLDWLYNPDAKNQLLIADYILTSDSGGCQLVCGSCSASFFMADFTKMIKKSLDPVLANFNFSRSQTRNRQKTNHSFNPEVFSLE